ncbi:hypothetical protein FHW89_004158 [Mucilaginibacter sp. SG564]|nr:hypothetical protein [Mucilaginibacter sp. SG564]
MYGLILSVNGGFVSVNGENIFMEKWGKWLIMVTAVARLQPSDDYLQAYGLRSEYIMV